jgi:hypothetical protein
LFAVVSQKCKKSDQLQLQMHIEELLLSGFGSTNLSVSSFQFQIHVAIPDLGVASLPNPSTLPKLVVVLG